MVSDLAAAQDLLSRYVGQLVHGCGHLECREAMCATGRHNVFTTRPLRSYTPRSARAIALALVGGPAPRQHLCVHYERAGARQEDVPACSGVPEGPRDPSSFEQLFIDTTSSQRLFAPEAEVLVAPTGFERHLAALQPLLQPVCLDGDVPGTFISNHNAARIISEALLACLHSVPQNSIDQHVNALTCALDTTAPSSLQITTAPGDQQSQWVQMLDGLDRAQPLMSCLCEATAKRVDLELCVDSLRSLPNAGDDLPQRFLPLLAESLETGMVCIPTLKRLTTLRQSGLMVLLFNNWRRPVQNADHSEHAGHWTIPQTSAAVGVLHLKDCIESRARPDRRSDMAKYLRIPVAVDDVRVVEAAKDWTARPPGFSSLVPRCAIHINGSRNDCRCARHGPVEHRGAGAGSERSGLQLLASRFMYTPAERALYFRTINHLKMQKVHATAEKATALRRRVAAHTLESQPESRIIYAEEHYLLLSVSRNNVLHDAYDQLWQRRSEELLRPLRVRLGELEGMEVGHDLGGVQIEFFNLVCKEAFAEDAGLFTTNSTGISYFRAGSLQPLYMFELLGLLFALAVYNGITLPVSMPLHFYDQLLGGTVSALDGLRDGWPEEAKSLGYLIDTPGAEDDTEYLFPMEANGVRIYATEALLERDGTLRVAHAVSAADSSINVNMEDLEWPGIRFVQSRDLKTPAVTASNKEKYAHEYASWLTSGAVAPQLDAFHRDFLRVVDRHSLSVLVTPQNLRALVEGSTNLDVEELRKATRYDGFDPDSKYIAGFWRMLKGWPDAKQRQLLKFVTAAERMPMGGPGHLTFVIQRAQPLTTEYLPTTSTCFGTLQLPHYPSVAILDQKLSLAIKYGLEGFGTG
ncbi:hypothetical protein LTR53_002007 [Teratosphaeriaceae sp. CCFEE 6253]|nr:hypothetical protein LTR53_002007 [Teratosphaeriaceae sp. CCFEE 6253]